MMVEDLTWQATCAYGGICNGSHFCKGGNVKHPDGFQIAVAFDQLINTFLGGWADETLSARAWRHKLDGSRSWPAWIIDHLFFWQKDHCRTAWESELERAHLPPSMRGGK